MYSNSDLERFFLRYKSEALTSPFNPFALETRSPYNLFEKWYKDTRHKLVPVQVTGQPDSGQPEPADPQESLPVSC